MKKLRIKATVAVHKNADTSGLESSETISLIAVKSDDPKAENKKWGVAKPEMNLDATISNPDMFGVLDGVREVYVDITPVQQKPARKSSRKAVAKNSPARIAPKKSPPPKTTKKGKRR